ncbi:MAG: hypothetical protein HETSPECPRED_004313 [Heterodermia speciosa]|uniref:Uncharacterized protein n=1 Tax=Heterodermia speciosa TaxID=116794 RepID=A0A8H3F9I9_9LECA|nr:MAG: hypothetical protein HETSPECPRED_004313 [Heterodermia speciosa]
MLSLPPEIRNLIYCSVYAFKSIYPATRNGLRSLILFSDNGFEDELPPSEVLALLLVNRQILKEAAAIFYGKIQFEQFMHDMPRFIKGIGRMRANLLTDLVLVQSQDMILEHSPLECLFPLEGLRIVRLEFEYEYFPNLKDELLRAGILQFTGRFDIEVLNTWPDTEVYVDRVGIWSCEKGATKWKGPKETVTWRG